MTNKALPDFDALVSLSADDVIYMHPDGEVFSKKMSATVLMDYISASIGFPVDSVNGLTGTVVLDSDDIPEGLSNFYFTNTRFDTRLSSKNENDLSGDPLSASFTYNADGTVNTLTRGSITKTFSYNGDGTVNTIADGTFTKTFSYNADGSVSSIAVT